MKKLITRNFFIRAAIILVTLGLWFCSKDEPEPEDLNSYQSSGIITGPDFRKCACCGGWFIEIDGTTYNFESLPDNSGIDLSKETFPINVKLDWELKTGPCINTYILVKRIRRS